MVIDAQENALSGGSNVDDSRKSSDEKTVGLGGCGDESCGCEKRLVVRKWENAVVEGVEGLLL
jgi:hypothetical protein